MAPFRDRMPALDALRLVAALSVLTFHWAFRGGANGGPALFAYPWLMPAAKYGYLGVDLFFIISGFVIFRSATHGDPRRFVASRVARLYPAFWCCCAATMLVVRTFGPAELQVSFSAFLVNLSMLAGFAGVPDVDGVYWSLYVELRFYGLVFAVLCLGWLERAERLMGVWLVAVLCLCFIPSWTLRSWLLYDYAHYFVAGATLARVSALGWSPFRAVLFAASCVMAIGHGIDEALVITARYYEPYDARVVAALIALALACVAGIAARPGLMSGCSACVTAGALTYPLYLIHQNIGYTVFRLWNDVADPHLLFWGGLALALVTAWLVHRLVEVPWSDPLRHGISRLLRRRVGAR